MALASASPFASFDINANTQILDISEVLSEALLLDFNLMARGLDVAMSDPVEDTTFYWNEEALNPDQVTVSSASQTSTSTSIALTTGHGTRVHIGDLLRDLRSGSTETMEVTDISGDSLTVTRTYNSTVAASIASAATLVVEPAFQEGSDIGADKSVKPIARSNFTQIVFAGDLLITRSQLSRTMATIAMDVDRQLANRAKELKRYWTSIAIYGEKAGSSGSDSVYRTTLGLRGWIRDNSGVLEANAAALSLTNLNTVNKSIVDKGEYVNTLLIGTDLVNSVNAIDASNRRLVESDREVGYFVERVLLGQGNEVEVVIDGRVMTGDAFLYPKSKFRWRPLKGGAMFIIAATDFVDGVKRRIGSEAGIEVRQPEAMGYLSLKT
jgi:uncharacterized protein DUF5309